MRSPCDIQQILRRAQQTAYRNINKAMLGAYWLIGKRIVEEEQQSESRAAYGKAIIENLSKQLQKEFGKGFSVRNIEQMRLFYLEYQISQTLSAKLPQSSSKTLPKKQETPDLQLTWSHYQMLLRISDKDERMFYEKGAKQGRAA